MRWELRHLQKLLGVTTVYVDPRSAQSDVACGSRCADARGSHRSGGTSGCSVRPASQSLRCILHRVTCHELLDLTLDADGLHLSADRQLKVVAPKQMLDTAERVASIRSCSVSDRTRSSWPDRAFSDEPDGEIKARVMRAVQDLRIEHLLDRYTDQTSGGDRQRVALARALVRRPKLFLLDEPLSALDLKLREALQSELRDMHRRRAQTLVYASHDFLSTAAIASRIAVIDEGRLLQTGTLFEIYADPAHRRIGELIGSPSMSLVAARVRDAMLWIGGLSGVLAGRVPGTTSAHRGGPVSPSGSGRKTSGSARRPCPTTGRPPCGRPTFAAGTRRSRPDSAPTAPAG